MIRSCAPRGIRTGGHGRAGAHDGPLSPDRETLICLDTCEHVLDGAVGLAGRLLRAVRPDPRCHQPGATHSTSATACGSAWRYFQRLMNPTAAVLTSSGFPALRKCLPSWTTRSSAPAELTNRLTSSSALATEYTGSA